MEKRSDKTLIDQNQSNDPGAYGIDEYELYYGENALREPDVRKPDPGPLSRRPRITSVYPFLVFLIIFFICTVTMRNSSLSDYLWGSRDSVFAGHEYWRLLTLIFTHSDMVHLLSNLPLLFFFSIFLYEYFGFFFFPFLSLIIGAGANAVTLFFYPDAVRLVGASGMVYGMVSLWLVLYICLDTEHSMQKRILRSVGFSLVMMFPSTYSPQTSYLAHLSGFVLGVICAVIVLPLARYKIRSNKTAVFHSD